MAIRYVENRRTLLPQTMGIRYVKNRRTLYPQTVAIGYGKVFMFCYFFPQITTDLFHKCTEEFKGTSSAAPIAAGIFSLTLEAK
jgi:hypothetical protein